MDAIAADTDVKHSGRVTILQEYVPVYRTALFEQMREIADGCRLDLRIAAGEPNEGQRQREDAAQADWIEPLRQREFRVFGRRLTVRRSHRASRSAHLLVLEQARRNLDVYRLLIPARLRRQRIALWGHGRDYVHEPGRVDRWLMRLLTRRADWFFAYTAGGRAAVIEQGVPGERVTVLNNSIDARQLRNELLALRAEEREAFSRTWDLHDATMLAIGGLDSSKRLDVLIAAGDTLAGRRPDFRLLVAGAGPQAGELARLASTRPWLRLLGRVDGRDKALALDATTAICNPGRVGLVVIDSFVAARPILTTSSSQHAPEAEYLQDGGNSLVVPEDPDSFALGMQRLLEDADLTSRLRAGCAASAEEYSLDRMAARFVDGLRSCLTAPRR